METNSQSTLIMSKAEYNEDAEAYTENGFHWGFCEGLNAARCLARQRGIEFPKVLFDDALKMRKAIYQAIKQ